MRVNVAATLLRCKQESSCIVPEEGLGPHILTVDGLRIRLHRYIWISAGRELAPNEFLLSYCATPGCVTYRHRYVSNKPYQFLEQCRNGHPYTGLDRLPDGSFECHQCREIRYARKRKGGLPYWKIEKARLFCPAGHEYTPDNTYKYETPSGGVRRKCRTCTLARRRGLDPADVVAA